MSRYLLQSVYLSVIMLVVSYAILTGPKAGQPISYFMSGLALGIGFCCTASQLYLKYIFTKQK